MSLSELPEVRETRTGAYGICIRDGAILVIRKAKGPYKGLLDLPGGGIEFGETPAETVVREFLEKTGMKIIVTEIAGAFSRVSRFIADTGTRTIELHHMGFLYWVAEAEPGLAVKTDPDGLDSLGAVWLPIDEATAGAVSPLVAEALRHIK